MRRSLFLAVTCLLAVATAFQSRTDWHLRVPA